MHKSPLAIALVFCAALGVADAVAQNAVVADEQQAIRERVLSSLQFEATQDDTTDANLFDRDGWIYTAATMARKEVKQGNFCDGVSIAGDNATDKRFLRFEKKTKPILLYKAVETMAMRPKPDWEGTVSFWLRLDPKELPPGYVDPFIVTQRAWNDGAFFVDFDKVTPRTFRFGAFSDLKHWNPEGTDWEKVPEEKRPMITVKDPPFAKDKWTHVCFTFQGVNSTSDEKGSASLYLDGKIQGTLRRDFRFTWNKPSEKVPPAAAMLGIGYRGDFDQLMYFNRALDAEEVGWVGAVYGRKMKK